MKTFEYDACAVDGSAVHGRTWALDELRLDRELEARGLTLLRAKVVAAARSGRSTQIGTSELINLTNQLATVTGAGVRIVEGLSGIGPRMESLRARRLVDDMVTGLQSGLSLSEVMQRHSESFPEVYQASVRAGEQSGALEKVLSRMARYLEWTRGMRSTTAQAMIYPAILMSAIAGLVGVLLYFVLPRLVGLFPGGRAQLPFETRMVLALSDFVHAHGLWLLGGAIAAACAFRAGLKRKAFREWFHGLVLRLPKLGTIARQLATSRFASTASILQDAGCDVYSVLTVSGATCGNAAMAAGFVRVADGVRRGATITGALEKEKYVDPLLLQMISVGEKSGELDRCLAKLVAYYDEEIPRAVRRFLSLLEPALLLLSGAIVAFILMAALMPIFSLYDQLG